MEIITRFVHDLGPAELSALARLVGHDLRQDQQVIIQIVNAAPPETENADHGDELPPWCHVYAGLTDDQIARIEQSIVRTATSRTFE